MFKLSTISYELKCYEIRDEALKADLAVENIRHIFAMNLHGPISRCVSNIALFTYNELYDI